MGIADGWQLRETVGVRWGWPDRRPMAEGLRLRVEWAIVRYRTAAEALAVQAHVRRVVSPGDRAWTEAWHGVLAQYRLVPSLFSGNLALNEGINAMLTLLAAGAETAYSNGNARIGVGNSNAAPNATQTGLLGASTLYKAMDATYPTYGTNQQIVFRATFGSGEANWAWEEFTIDNGAAAGKNLNRKTQAEGTKVAGQVWEATVTLTGS